MPSINIVTLAGNLTRDPELRHTKKGTAVALLGLAINRKAGDEEKVTFVDVQLWERQAELAEQYLRKGNPVLIEGRLEMDSWQDRQSGQNRTKLKIVAHRVHFLGPRDSSGKPAQRQHGPPGAVDPAPVDYRETDDIPF